MGVRRMGREEARRREVVLRRAAIVVGGLGRRGIVGIAL